MCAITLSLCITSSARAFVSSRALKSFIRLPSEPLGSFFIVTAKSAEPVSVWSNGYLTHVFRVVVRDLKAKEVMNRFQPIGICCLNAYLATCWQFFESVGDLSTFFFHDRYAGRHLVMDEHWNGEFSGGE